MTSHYTPPASPEVVQQIFANVFRGGDGDRALSYLRAMTLDRAMGPHVSTEQLWHLEGQRHLARHILKLVERGRAPA
jgi:hypothetical protein